MIITKEHQEAMVENYKKGNKNITFLEEKGFIDGMNAMYELIERNLKKETAQQKASESV